MKLSSSSIVNYALIFAITFFVVSVITSTPPDKAEMITYSQMLDKIKSKEITKAFVDEETQIIYGLTQEQHPLKAIMPNNDPLLVNDLFESGAEFGYNPKEKPGFGSVLLSWTPLFIILFVWIWLMRRQMGAGGGSGSLTSFGKSKARSFEAGEVSVRFSDVAGVEESKEEVSEIVDFLSDRERFVKVGGKIPRGVLMVGGPGCGKTLLAKAIAGEAHVPFYSISGSDFVEMFVGVGASRVRDLFAEAKKHAPCIIFIDEIDAVGRKRGSGVGGGNDEREQTLNALLVEMDGFEGNEGIIVIAATNRPDVLDNALLRPGRFDRQVHVPLPDVRGREQILEVHVRKISLDDSVDLSVIARGTPGFSGADLANLANEAALMAARARKDYVDMNDFEKAKDKILMGTERRSMIMSDEEKKLTAYHEAGHAIVGFLSPDHDPVHKVSIIPRGRALGVTMYLPDEDRVSYSKQRLESQLKSLYGGRIAEEMIFGEEHVTTGASNDIQRATELATNMIKRWGFSKKVGPLSFVDEDGAGYLGHSGIDKRTSDKVSEILDDEIRDLIEKNYGVAEKILKDNIDILHSMANALIKFETIDRNQVTALMNRETLEEVA